jgi:polyhydroxyalkanoate synthesis repressor PhaR
MIRDSAAQHTGADVPRSGREPIKMAPADQASSAGGGRKGDASGSRTDAPHGDDRVVIKKYANRRLYNTASSSYVTLDHLADMVREGVDFVVYDAKSGEDITRTVLTQIIFEEEGRGQNLLPIQFLRQLIRFYGDSMQALLPSYLEMSLDNFTRQQDRLRTEFAGAMGGTEALERFQTQVRQNMTMFERAMKMFSPFAYAQGQTEAEAPPPPQPAAEAKSGSDEALNDLKSRIEEMQRQIEKLASKS